MARQPAAAVPNVGHLKSGCFFGENWNGGGSITNNEEGPPDLKHLDNKHTCLHFPNRPTQQQSLLGHVH